MVAVEACSAPVSDQVRTGRVYAGLLNDTLVYPGRALVGKVKWVEGHVFEKRYMADVLPRGFPASLGNHCADQAADVGGAPSSPH